MHKSLLKWFAVVVLLAVAACAQGIQNSDIYIAAGPAWNDSNLIDGTSVRVAGSWGANVETDYGYQIARASAASLLLDLSFNFVFPGGIKTNVPVSKSSSNSWDAATTGLRFMVPMNSRLSFYALAGGGVGAFSSFVVNGGNNPSFSSNDTVHGVFTFGGGADIRLSPHFSLRLETRDFVTGKQLSGASGRNHVLPMFGVAFHF